MNEHSAETLLAELLDRGVVSEDRVDRVEELRREGEVWSALEYAVSGRLSERWPPEGWERETTRTGPPS